MVGFVLAVNRARAKRAAAAAEAQRLAFVVVEAAPEGKLTEAAPIVASVAGTALPRQPQPHQSQRHQRR